ncbi:protein containing DUF1703 [Candidatus Omnitrophus magneticus]|uniref:Protein containing DUF1703 n=1 Tax=Candidatus Omnitrophus magneticus TaxID=1609969 RepID=A0A0F0CPE7_9BACT|nr:protein containing DUF1703 [Candidatus Omnitrophus magneticus]
MTRGGVELREELEKLIKGEVLDGKEIEENTIFSDIKDNDDLVWSFLLLSGYLTYEKIVYSEDTANFLCDLKVPNKEICSIYKGIIKKWFGARIEEQSQRKMLLALRTGDIDTFEEIFSEFVMKSLSYFDTGKDHSEKVYKSFVLGLLIALADKYEIENEKEAGRGRSDLILTPKNKTDFGIIIEFKKVDARKKEKMPQAVKAAFKQIEEKQYDLVNSRIFTGICTGH